MKRPLKEKPTFPVGYRFSIDKDQIGGFGPKKPQPSPSDVLRITRGENLLEIVLYSIIINHTVLYSIILYDIIH